MATNQFGYSKIDFELQILFAPFVEKSLVENISIPFNENNGKISFDISGNPMPRIKWFHRGANDIDFKEMDIFENLTTISTSKISGSFEGTFKAVATNDFGTVEKQFLVKGFVNEAPIITKKENFDISVAVGGNIELECNTELWDDSMEIIWLYKVAKNVNPKGNKLAINEATDTNEGSYECIVRNNFGEDRILYNVTILGPPKVEKIIFGTVVIANQSIIEMIENENQNGQCVFTGNPQPLQYWMKNNEKIIENEST